MKKMLLALVALVLIITISVTGSLAYFTDKTEAVTNTFAAAKMLDDNGTFTLTESKATAKGDGTFELDVTTRVKENSEYTVLPNVSIPKDPRIDITGLSIPAYLYVKVDNALHTGMSFTLAEDWTQISDTNVYYYTNKLTDAEYSIRILKDDMINVSSTYDGSNSGSCTLNFTAYSVQATGNGSDAASAWNNVKGTFNIS